MKNVTIAGNVGKDAILRRTGGGDPVLGFTVAVEERHGKEKRTIWFDVAMWGKRGESLEQYITKGGKVVVSGDLSTREHDGKTYLTVKADQVTLLGGKSDGGRDDRGGDGGGTGGSGYGAGGRPSMDDEIPFIMEWR